MTIESTKKIIASIILAIMLLGLTTPTFAATKDIDFIGVAGKLWGFAKKAAEIAIPAMKDIANKVTKIDTNEIKTNGKAILNMGNNLLGSLLTITTSEKNKTTGITNIFKNMFKKDNTEPGVAGVTGELREETDDRIEKIENVVNKVGTEAKTLFGNLLGLTEGIINSFLSESDDKKVEQEEEEEVVVEETQREVNTNTTKQNSSDFKFTGYYFANGGASKDDNGLLGSGVKHEELTVNEEGWYMYEGKVVLATSTKPLLNTGKYAERDNIEYFNYYDEVEFEYNGKTYTGIVLDSCGAAMKTPIMDIRCAGGYYDHVNNTINQDVITVHY